MDEQSPENKTLAQKEEIAALEILGSFLLVLGAAMIVAVFWPPTWIGKLTDLAVALLLLLIGGGMIWRGRATRKRSPGGS
jgi:predicted phage tail protein